MGATTASLLVSATTCQLLVSSLIRDDHAGGKMTNSM